ncbi:MAG: tRNA (guanine-N7)-methyltransferase [Moraxellaceae bacterium]|nr:tRNA (guanine-N7)-methyltransferase [Pseudobdellovibrionaceae bacterium]
MFGCKSLTNLVIKPEIGLEVRSPRPQINLTRELPKPNAYAIAMDDEYKEIAFNEERAPLNKGVWREKVFNVSSERALDVEVGTGAGHHFAYHAKKYPERCLVGLEIKYKPLIQTIRRAQNGGGVYNAVCRYHAFNLDQLFGDNEVNNVYIHCPDPWVTPRKPRNRVVNRHILGDIYKMQRPGSFLEFKTDSREYFLWALEEIKLTPYQVEFQTLHLYGEETIYKKNNFQTGFEKIFVNQGIEINYIKLIK